MLEDLSTTLKKELRDTGVVYFLDLMDPESPKGSPSPRIVGYWEAEIDGEDTIIEAAPGFEELGVALRWAKRRASVVVVSTSEGKTTIFDYEGRRQTK
jgi:hypothetical protein